MTKEERSIIKASPQALIDFLRWVEQLPKEEFGQGCRRDHQRQLESGEDISLLLQVRSAEEGTRTPKDCSTRS
jgi:hypothetical protein